MFLCGEAWLDLLSVRAFPTQPLALINWELPFAGELPELRCGGADLQAEPDPSIHTSPPALPAPASSLRGHKPQL